ncbi:MAG: ABC transporter permease [Bdellovibrionales bacterium]
MRIETLLLKRFFWNPRALSARASLFALGGLALGVAVLYVSLAVMSGFEKTLQTSLTDVRGHLTAIKRSAQLEPWPDFFHQLQNLDSRVEEATPFLTLEGLVAGPGVVQGVVLQGLDARTFRNVMKLENRLLEGRLQFRTKKESGLERSEILVGRELAQRLGKTVGDSISVVVPRFGELETSGYRRTVGQFRISGILDLGKYEWNERLIIADLREVQRLAEVGSRYSGLLVKVSEPELADAMAADLVSKLGSPYWVRDWRSEHENTFVAVEIERRVIFVVVLILVVVAIFSLASNLLLQTLQRATDIAVLQAMGLSRRQILKLFVFQGLALGTVGLGMGLMLGWLAAQALTLYQAHWGLIAASVYKIGQIDLQVRGWDLVWIVSVTWILSLTAGLLPAYRAAQRPPALGLRYE